MEVAWRIFRLVSCVTKKIVKKFWWKSFGAKNELKSFLIYYAIWSEIGFQCYVYFVSVTTVNLDLFSINERYLILLPSFPIFVRIDRSRFPFTLFFGSLNRLTWISKVATDINLFSLLETRQIVNCNRISSWRALWKQKLKWVWFILFTWIHLSTFRKIDLLSEIQRIKHLRDMTASNRNQKRCEMS